MKSSFRWGAIALLVCAFVAAFPSQSRADTVKSDFVFIIDATSSMSGEIAGVRSGFSSFVSGLSSAGVDARFAVVVFGGQPELVLDFTSDATAAQTALNNIVIGASLGFQNNHNVNPEAGLEAIRMALGGAPVSEFANNNIAQDGLLDFRSDARKNLILATDEDSDLPFHAANRFGSQATTAGGDLSPTTFTSDWQDEVDATAQAVISSQAFINILMNRGDWPSIYQYGDYAHDVSDADLLNYDAAATLAALQGAGLGDSLQAQVLAAGLVGRTFNVAGANDPDFIDNFYAAKVEETVTQPPQSGVVPLPTAAWMGLGLLGLLAAGRRRRRRATA